MKTKMMTIDRWSLAKLVFTLLLCFVVSFSFAEGSPDKEFNNNYKYTKKRIIDTNFDAGENYTLNLLGKYSDYEISTWNENHISFHVEIIVKSNKEQKAEEQLYQIDIDFENSQANKEIMAKTVIPSRMNNVEFQIDYYIMIPRNIFLVIHNAYGNVNVDKLNRYLDLDLDYGNFSIDSLFGDNKMNLAYSNVKIKYADKVDAKIRYGNIRVNTGNDVNVNIQYGNGKFGDIQSLKAFCQYSDISCSDIEAAYLKLQYSDTYLKNVKDLTMDNSYSDVEIDHLLKKINFTSRYGDIEINKVHHDFELIDIKTEYSDVSVIFKESHKFSYNIAALHADVESVFLEDTAMRYIKKDDETTIIGDYNGSNDIRHVKIDIRYGDLEFELRNE